MKTLPPLALYVHMPWCVRKCPYCDFNSHRAPTALPVIEYIDALLADLDVDIDGGAVQGRELMSIFMGGGTPSLFSPADVGRLLSGVRARVPCVSEMEVTLEANPGTIERGAFREYAAAGVNRVSLGVQSFSDESLARLGRIHKRNEVFKAVDELHAATLDNFNLDLMYALPQQSLAEAVFDLDTALALEPAHISHYELTLEPGTVFYSRPPAALPDSDAAWDIQVACQERLASAGFEQYEVSAYARPNRRCRHNVNYWRFGDYLGIGAGAHGKVTHPSGVWRTLREKQPRPYLSAAAPDRLKRNEVRGEALAFEFMLNALRLHDGFALTDFEHATGLTAAAIAHPLEIARAKKLLECADGAWQTTPFGRRFLNDLQALFLPAEPARNVASS